MENQIIATSATVIEQVEQLARRPIPLTGADTALLYAVPDGYSVKDMSNLLEAPARKSGATAMHDVDSFITMVKRHGSLAECLGPAIVPVDPQNPRRQRGRALGVVQRDRLAPSGEAGGGG